MIKDTCFHPCNVASGDSTMIQWDRVSQESLEKKRWKVKFCFPWMKQHFIFSMSLSGFSTPKLHFVREMLVYSTNIFYDKCFLTDIFNQKTSSFFFLFFFLLLFSFSLTRTDFHLYWRLLQREWGSSSLHVFHEWTQTAGKKQAKIRKCFLL